MPAESQEVVPGMPLTPLGRGARWVLRGLLLLAGVASFVVAVKCFVQPNQLLSGGVTGTALLLDHLFGVPVGLGMALLNLPIFLLGFRFLGVRFGLSSAGAVLMTWVAADFLPLPPLTGDPMLAAIFGGVFTGLGSAVALRSGGSLGGFDILGVWVNRRFSMGVGEVLLVLNGALVIATGVIGSAELAMYTLVSIVAASWMLDSLQASRPRKAFLIMTRRADTVRQRIVAQMGRGITVFPAAGGWDGTPLRALLCVVTRGELRELADLVREADQGAFVVVLEASEVMGRFRVPQAGDYLRRLAPGRSRSTASAVSPRA